MGGPVLADVIAAVRAPRLSLELVPSTVWYSNLRTLLSSADWDRLRRACYRRAGYVCEICGGRGSRHPVEAHEVWDYDDERQIQRLDRLIALCPRCHQVKHFGHARVRGNERSATRHLMAVNGWGPEVAEEYLNLAFRLWEVRSMHDWQLDLSALEREGIQVPSRPVPSRKPADD